MRKFYEKYKAWLFSALALLAILALVALVAFAALWQRAEADLAAALARAERAEEAQTETAAKLRQTAATNGTLGDRVTYWHDRAKQAESAGAMLRGALEAKTTELAECQGKLTAAEAGLAACTKPAPKPKKVGAKTVRKHPAPKPAATPKKDRCDFFGFSDNGKPTPRQTCR